MHFCSQQQKGPGASSLAFSCGAPGHSGQSLPGTNRLLSCCSSADRGGSGRTLMTGFPLGRGDLRPALANPDKGLFRVKWPSSTSDKPVAELPSNSGPALQDQLLGRVGPTGLRAPSAQTQNLSWREMNVRRVLCGEKQHSSGSLRMTSLEWPLRCPLSQESSWASPTLGAKSHLRNPGGPMARDDLQV